MQLYSEKISENWLLPIPFHEIHRVKTLFHNSFGLYAGIVQSNTESYVLPLVQEYHKHVSERIAFSSPGMDKIQQVRSVPKPLTLKPTYAAT